MGCNPSSKDHSGYARSILKKPKLLKMIAKLQKKHNKGKNRVRDETEYTEEVFRIDFRHLWNIELLESISAKNRLEPIPTLALRYLPESQEAVPEFLNSCIDEVDHLFINNYVENEVKKNKIPIEPYISAICSVCPSVKESLWIEYFTLSIRDIAQIIRKGFGIAMIRFEQCLIDFSNAKELPNGDKVVTFNTENEPATHYLCFKGCNITEESLKIIANSCKELTSLKTLDISNTEFSVQEATDILDSCELSSVKVVKI
ncbi:unnamed protein product [Moneuplotes crassus]|uniref:Uncharacterized protein n=1 Tax=Euplotes crassus TaxID=5936 RepID=A0AAD1XRC5_EUPCR|nr:unnamed protein product [Moneuplotes crassus]